MFCFIKKIIFAFSFLLICKQTVFADFEAENTSSVFKVKKGASFILDKKIKNFKGTIEQEDESGIAGKDIDFSEGKFKKNDNKFDITGVYNPGMLNKIRLNGGKKFRGKGCSLDQSLEISGTGNILQGDFYTKEDINFLNPNASLHCGILNSLSSNILLNGGTLILEDLLKFNNGKKLIGPGKIIFNGNKLYLGSLTLVFINNLYFDSYYSESEDQEDPEEYSSIIELNSNIHLGERWTFSGNSVLEGNNNICFFHNDDNACGSFVIERGSSLLVRNVILDNVNNKSLFCMDNSGTITFQNVKLILDETYTFSLGKFFVIDYLTISGENIFGYNTDLESLVYSFSKIYLDCGITFSYDPFKSDRNDLLKFEDETSGLYLDNASLHAAKELQLTKGFVALNGICNFYSESDINREAEIIFGNGFIEDDFVCNIFSGSILNLVCGCFSYKNVGELSLNMINESSFLSINSDTTFNLYEFLNSGNGQIKISNGAQVLKHKNKIIRGAVSICEN